MGLAKIEKQMAAAGLGCLGRAADDEPVFILRAKDRFAPELVENWAALVERATSATVSGTGTVEGSRAKIKEARALAHNMRAWQEMNTSKTPD